MSRDTHKRLFNCEQDNKAETSTNSCPIFKYKLYHLNLVAFSTCLQCFDAVGWVAGRASGL